MPKFPFLLLLAAGIFLIVRNTSAQLTGAREQRFEAQRFTQMDGLPDDGINAMLQDRYGFLWIATPNGLARYDGYGFATYRPDPTNPASLSHRAVSTLLEDRRGRLWVGTWSGLDRFDRGSATFFHYRHEPDNPESLSDNTIRSCGLFEDGEGQLWIPTETGLDRLDPETGRVRRFGPDPGLSYGLNAEPYSFQTSNAPIMVEDHSGTLWIGTRGGGLNRLDREAETFTALRHDPEEPASLASDTVSVVYEAPSETGVLWLGTPDRGLDRLETETGRVRHFRHDDNDPTSLSSDFVIHIHEDRGGRLWVLTADHVLHRVDRSAGAFTRYRLAPAEDALHLAYVNHSFLEDRGGHLWLGFAVGRGISEYNRNRLYRFDPGSGTAVRYVEPGWVGTLLEDESGGLWLGSRSYRGLFNVDPWLTNFRSYREGSVGVQDFYDEPDGALWVLSSSRLLRLDRESEGFSDPWSGAVGGVSVVGDASGMLWTVSGGNLYRSDPRTGTFRVYSLDGDEPGNANVGEAYVDAGGTLWIGTSAGLSRYEPDTDTITRFAHDPDDPRSLPAPMVSSVLEDVEGELWVCSYDDRQAYLSRFDRRTGRFTSSPPLSLPTLNLRDASLSRDGAFWLPSDAGLYRYDPTAQTLETVFTQAEGLPDNGVQGVLEDDEGWLWISTRNGLCHYHPETGTYRNFDAADGLPSSRFFKAARRLRTGEMAFGTNNGFVLFDPPSVRQNPHAPSMVLTQVRIYNDVVQPGAGSPLQAPIEDADELRLSHRQNDVTISYAGLHFSRPEKIRYRYRLEGYEAVWREAGSRREAVYAGLPSGDYVFRVKATSADGVESEEGASIRVVVLPPWWRTPWAYALYGLLVLGLAAATLRAYRQRVEREERERFRERELEHAKEIERTNRDLEHSNRELETSLEALRTAKQELERLDAEKNDFFANISHEFRTPLTLLLGPIEDALRFGKTLSGEELAVMRRNATRLQRHINQLLDLSKLEAGSLGLNAQPHDLEAFVRGIAAHFESRAKRSAIAFNFHAEGDCSAVYFDAEKLEKVIFNLLSNAFKFTAEHGKIHVHLKRQADTVTIAVKDTGVGIPAENLPHIFSRFYQGASSGTQVGTGIGLALAKEIVNLHGGRIAVESEAGFGSTFTVTLPVEQAPSETPSSEQDEPVEWPVEFEESNLYATAADGEEEVADDTAPLVLLVEDHADMRAYIGRHLRSFYRVVEAEHGAEGLRLAREHMPDLVLSDVMMPEMDGFELCRRLKTDEDLGHIPVILLTARASDESKLEGLETGADAYLFKPFDAAELLVRVENLIELRRYLYRRYAGESVLHPSPVVVPSADVVFLEQLKAVVEDHLGDTGFNVDWLADEVGLSPRQLQRRLREAADLSAAGYIRMMRLERGAQLLEQSAGTVSEIAYRVGFKNARHFSQLFRQVFGVPPSEYVTKRDTNVRNRDTE